MSKDAALALKDPVVIDKRRHLTADDMTDMTIPSLDRAVILRHPQATEVMGILAAINGRTLGSKVLILPLPPDDHYGPLTIPDYAQADQHVGIVVGVGRGSVVDGKLLVPEVELGNYVQFSDHVANKIKVGSYEVFQVHEQEISFAAGNTQESRDASKA